MVVTGSGCVNIDCTVCNPCIQCPDRVIHVGLIYQPTFLPEMLFLDQKIIMHNVFSRLFFLQDAISLEMIRQNHDRLIPHSTDPSTLIDRVVFIDSTWQQCHQIITVSTSTPLSFILPSFEYNLEIFWILQSYDARALKGTESFISKHLFKTPWRCSNTMATIADKVRVTGDPQLHSPPRRNTVMCAAHITGTMKQKPDKVLTWLLFSSFNINSCFLFCNNNPFFKDEKLKELQRVKLEKAVTHFWRQANNFFV